MTWLKATCFVMVMIFGLACSAQDITDVEAKPYGSYSGGKIDTVDLATGNLLLNIPLISYPQRGSLPPLSFSVELNNAPYSQTWDCDALGTVDPTTGEVTSPQNGYEMECEVLSSRYDTSPPGAVFQYQGPNPTIWPTQSNVPTNDPTCGGDGTPCGYDDVWGSEYDSNTMQSMGAYLTSSFNGGIVTAQDNLLLGDLNGGPTIAEGAYQYTMVDPSGTTHELEADTTNAPASWNTYHASDGSGYTFIPSNTPNSNPAGTENAYNAFEPADGWSFFDSNADWIGMPDSDLLGSSSALRLGTLYSPTGVTYTDTIQAYPPFPSNSYSLGTGEPYYTPRALYSVAQDPSGNKITRGPWFWSGYYSQGSPFLDIQSIYSNPNLGRVHTSAGLR